MSKFIASKQICCSEEEKAELGGEIQDVQKFIEWITERFHQAVAIIQESVFEITSVPTDTIICNNLMMIGLE